MKIAIITEAWEPQVSGVVTTYKHIKKELEREGHEVKIVHPNSFLLNTSIPTYKEIRTAWPLPYGMTRQLKDFKPDHIHIATEGPLGWYAALFYCKKHGIPFTTAYHTNFADYIDKRLTFLPGFLKKQFHKVSTAAIARFHNMGVGVMTVSEEIDRQMREMGVTVPLNRLSRGVDTDIFHPGPQTLFTEQKLPVAVYVGRVAIEKNIKAFLDLEIPFFKVVVGGGPQLEELKREYPDVHFAGPKFGEELAEHYRAGDVFVFPSKTDTFGLVLIEALACGLPVAAYDEGGHTVILSDPKLGAYGSNLSKTFWKAANAPGTAEDRFAHIQQNYSWAAAARQFIANGAALKTML